MGHPDQSDSGLARLHVPGDLALLESQARQAMAELGDPGGTPEGADPTNSIWVTTDRDGRVHSVEVSRQWRDRIEPGEFGNALFQAYSSANFKAVAAAARSDLDGGGAAPGAVVGEPVADLLDSPNWLANMREVLEKAEQRVEAADRMRRQGQAPDDADRTIASPNGMLTLKLRAGALVAITSDIMSIRRADAEQLRMEILDVFRDADLIASH